MVLTKEQVIANLKKNNGLTVKSVTPVTPDPAVVQKPTTTQPAKTTPVAAATQVPATTTNPKAQQVIDNMAKANGVVPKSTNPTTTTTVKKTADPVASTNSIPVNADKYAPVPGSEAKTVDSQTGKTYKADGTEFTGALPNVSEPATDQYTKVAANDKTVKGKPLDVNTSQNAIDYQAEDQARLDQIQQNLTNYSQTSPGMFKDRATFESNFNYGARSEAQKKVLDSFYKDFNLKQGNPDTVFQTLMAGGQIDPVYQNTEGFKLGYQKYQNIGMLSSLDAKGLARQIGSRVLVGSAEWKEIAKVNPQLAQDALAEKNKLDAERAVNGTLADTTGIESDRVQEVDVVTKAMTTLYEKLGSLNINIAEEYKKNVLENPEINERYAAIVEKSKKIAELTQQRESAIDDAYASAGGAPDSVIRARANQAYRAIDNQINLMQSDLEIEQVQLQSDIDRYTGMYTAKIDEYNQEIAQFKDQAGFVMGIANTVAGTLTDQREQKAAKEATRAEQEYNMKLEQAKQEYQMTRDDQAYQRDVNLAQWKYQQDLQSMQLKSNLDLQNQMVLSQQKAQLEGGNQGGQTTAGSIQNLIGGLSDQKLAMKDGSDGGECGVFANRAVGLSSEPGGIDTVAGRTATYTDTVPTAGGLVFFGPGTGKGNDVNGHVAVVMAVNGNSMTIKQSNADGKSKKVTTDVVPVSSATGFYNNTPLAKAQGAGKQYNNSKAAVTETTQLRKEFNALQEVKDYKNTKTNLDKVKNSAQLKSAAGDMSLIFGYMKLLDPGSTVREGEYATAEQAGGIKDKKIFNLYNKAVNGEKLTESQRADFLKSAESQFAPYQNTYNTRLQEYQGYIQQGGDPGLIGVSDDGLNQSTTTTGGWGGGR